MSAELITVKTTGDAVETPCDFARVVRRFRARRATVMCMRTWGPPHTSGQYAPRTGEPVATMMLQRRRDQQLLRACGQRPVVISMLRGGGPTNSSTEPTRPAEWLWRTHLRDSRPCAHRWLNGCVLQLKVGGERQQCKMSSVFRYIGWHRQCLPNRWRLQHTRT